MTGTIYTNKSLSYDPKKPVVQLTVRATDRGVPSRSTVAAVRIQIADVNNNAPRFLESAYRSVKKRAEMHLLLGTRLLACST